MFFHSNTSLNFLNTYSYLSSKSIYLFLYFYAWLPFYLFCIWFFTGIGPKNALCKSSAERRAYRLLCRLLILSAAPNPKQESWKVYFFGHFFFGSFVRLAHRGNSRKTKFIIVNICVPVADTFTTHMWPVFIALPWALARLLLPIWRREAFELAKFQLQSHTHTFTHLHIHAGWLKI